MIDESQLHLCKIILGYIMSFGPVHGGWEFNSQGAGTSYLPYQKHVEK